MSYIGNEPTSVAFLTDTFSGNGSTTAFTLSAAPATTSSILVAITGVLQDPSTYSVSGTTLTFSPAPPTGTSNISVRFLGIPASGVTTTAYRTVTEFTATAGQTTFSVPSYTVGFIDVYRNGVMLGSADYTATNGLTVVLASGATAGDLVEVISFQVSSVLNAVQATGTTFSGNVLFASGNGIWNTSGNVGVGTASPATKLHVSGANGVLANFQSAGGLYGAIYADANGVLYGGASTADSSGSNYTYISPGGNLIAFVTNSTERARIDSSGNFRATTTGTYLGDACHQLGVNNANSYGLIVFNSSASPASEYLIESRYSASTPNNTSARFFNCADSTNAKMYVWSNGGIANYSGNNSNLSDAREKTNVELAGPYLDKICAIPVKTFNYIDQNLEEDDGLTLGVIAQEVQAVAPELVSENDWGTQEEPKMRLSIYQTDLQYALMKCIQEQQAIITDLKARIEALENK
jgi:hypothetical protein